MHTFPKKKITAMLFTLAVVYIVITGSAGGRATVSNVGNTGAPGEPSTCSGCHTGGSYGTVTPLIELFPAGTTTAVNAYQPGTIYDMKVTVQYTAGTPGGFGFQMTCLTAANNTAVAGYSNLASNVQQKTLTSSGRTYVEQKSAGTSNVYTMKWTAPATGTGSVKFYAAGNAVNRTGGRTGDKAGTASVTIFENQQVSVAGAVTNVSCNGGNSGAINITASSGTAPYAYNWDNGITTEDRTSLAAGNYSVTVTDYAGETASATYTITQPPKLDIAVTQITDDAGAGTGAIDIEVSGGTSPDYYQWSNGAATQDINQLSAGDYTCSVTDAEGCIVSENFTVGVFNAIVESNAEHVEVFPNPFSNEIIIRTGSGRMPDEILLFNSGGQQIDGVQIQKNKEQLVLKLDALPPALYVLCLQFKDDIVRMKVLKTY